jgi:hypothetical protein
MVAAMRDLPRYSAAQSRLAEMRLQQGDQMSRNLILAIGALLWTVVAIQEIVRIITGDWTATALVAIVGVAWVALRRARWSPLRLD